MVKHEEWNVNYGCLTDTNYVDQKINVGYLCSCYQDNNLLTRLTHIIHFEIIGALRSILEICKLSRTFLVPRVTNFDSQYKNLPEFD